MTDAPERIWLDPAACFGRSRSAAVANAVTKARGKAWETDAEYIRLDLHEAAVAAARAEGMREAAAIAMNQEVVFSDDFDAGWNNALKSVSSEILRKAEAAP